MGRRGEARGGKGAKEWTKRGGVEKRATKIWRVEKRKERVGSDLRARGSTRPGKKASRTRTPHAPRRNETVCGVAFARAGDTGEECVAGRQGLLGPPVLRSGGEGGILFDCLDKRGEFG